jgi:hypothetical protein
MPVVVGAWLLMIATAQQVCIVHFSLSRVLSPSLSLPLSYTSVSLDEAHSSPRSTLSWTRLGPSSAPFDATLTSPTFRGAYGLSQRRRRVTIPTGGSATIAASDGPLTSFRITIAYFCLSALDLLGALDDHVALEQRQSWADWIWSLQSREWAGRRID